MFVLHLPRPFMSDTTFLLFKLTSLSLGLLFPISTYFPFVLYVTRLIELFCPILNMLQIFLTSYNTGPVIRLLHFIRCIMTYCPVSLSYRILLAVSFTVSISRALYIILLCPISRLFCFLHFMSLADPLARLYILRCAVLYCPISNLFCISHIMSRVKPFVHILCPEILPFSCYHCPAVTWDQAKDKPMAHYMHRDAKGHNQRRFDEKRQTPDESITNYITSKRHLARRVDTNMDFSYFIDKVIEGMIPDIVGH